MIDINEGRTGALAALAVLTGVCSVISWFFFPPLSIFLGILTILLFSVSTGLQLNPETKEYRPYYGLFGLRFGKWKEFPSINAVHLELSVDQIQVKRWLPKTAMDRSTATETNRTFNLLFIFEERTETFFEFFDYRLAERALNEIGSILQIEVRNLFLERINEN